MFASGRFKHDVFISYAHLDDVPSTIHREGWVTPFAARLREVLSGRLGRIVDVWQDYQLGGNEPLTEALRLRLRESAILLPVASPAYVAREWCIREMKEFLDTHRADYHLRARVVIVVKHPFDYLKWPFGPSPLTAFRFYDHPPGENYYPPLSPFEPAFEARLNEVAEHIDSVLKELGRARDTPAGGENNDAAIV
jgi:TIR domain